MIGSGNVSLLAVRDDLDLTGNFSLRTNAAGKHKATWDDTTDLRLTEYRSNVLGQQYDKKTQTDERSRNQFEQGNFNHNGSIGVAEVRDIDPAADSTTVFPDKPRATKNLYLRCNKAQYIDDVATEGRHFGFITEGGSYKVQCFVNKVIAGTGAEPYSKISIVQYRTGYMSGLATVKLDDAWGRGDRWVKYEKTVTLDADKPYVAVIVYAISRGQSTSLRNAECYYTAIQLDKV
jgi:hypothetical protein